MNRLSEANSDEERQSRRGQSLLFGTDDLGLEQKLRDLYHSPRTGYRPIENLYRKLKEKFPNATREQVRNFLRHLHENISNRRSWVGDKKISKDNGWQA